MSLASLVFISLSGCTTPPPAPVDPAELMKRELKIGAELLRQIEPRFSFLEDAELKKYLGTIGQILVSHVDGLQSFPVRISLIRNKLTGQKNSGSKARSKNSENDKWRNFGFPGNRLYLSVELLKLMEFENEVAAMVSVELAHLQKKHLLSKLEKKAEVLPEEHKGSFKKGKILPDDPRLSSTSQNSEDMNREFSSSSQVGLAHSTHRIRTWAFSMEEEREAARSAVEILYRAGYDPRGLVSYYARFGTYGDRSPYSARELKEILAEVRHEIFAYSPLRNPIVQSADFLKIRKRIQQ